MRTRKENFSGSEKSDFFWIEVILLSFLTCIAILLLYSSFNRYAEDTAAKDSKITAAAGDVEIHTEKSTY